MRRWIAVAFLLLVAFYVGATAADRCEENPAEGAQICHILCHDGCATAPIPEPPVAPPGDALPRRRFESARVAHLVSLEPEPEKDPPRA